MRARLFVLLVALGIPLRAWATTANDLCSPLANPCYVLQGRTVAVTNGSVIDLGGRALVLASGSGTRLDAGTGSMTIIAGSVTLNPGSALLARSGTITVLTTGNVSVLRSGTARARIDVADFLAPGAITVDAGGTIDVQGVVTAQGSGADAGSGGITLLADHDVLVSGEVNAASGIYGYGGDVALNSSIGAVAISGVVDVTAGFGGGSIDIAAAGSVTTTALTAARLDAKATGVEGDGGTVDISAIAGDIVLNIPLNAQGTTGVDLGGGGGDVSIDAFKGSVYLNAPIELSGAVPDGDGGDLDVSGGTDVVQNAKVTSNGRDLVGVGGGIDLFAKRKVTVDSIEARGTCLTCTGGDVLVQAWCGITVPLGAILDMTGAGGSVTLQSGGFTEVHGIITAGQSIRIDYRSASNPPNLSGAVLSPRPVVGVLAGLIPCGGPVTPGCGNGIIDPGETCDDRNQVSCDGCSSTCRIERCGDGILGCDELHVPEVCDDGNTGSCDGCVGDCSRRDDVCGDGTKECGEECDTGSAIDCDAGACSAQCRIETCGNGRAECNEECDDGGPSESCSGTCTFVAPTTCGDGVKDPGEGCDDGNTIDCDGCSRLCQKEECGNNTVECAEECDDLNTISCDGCSATCKEETCGNGVVDCGEECDLGDENGKPGTNCLLDCRNAPTCSAGSSDACVPCNDVLDCDPLGRCAGTDCMDGVCTPDPIDCTSDDPCEVGTCDAMNGCMFAPVLLFDSVRCRLDDLDGVLGGDGISDKARAKLGKMVSKAGAKVDAAETALDAGKNKKVGKSLDSARGSMVRFGKKVVKLQPKQITDPDLGSALSGRAADALERIESLRGDLGV